MTYIKVKENEPFDLNLRRFKRSCEKAAIVADVRKKDFYEKPTWVKKRKMAAAQKRTMRKHMREIRHKSKMY